MFGSLGVPELLVLVVVGAVSAIIVIWPAARICAKAGYSPWLGLAVVIPIANVLLLWFLAIAEWPQRRAA
jgi:energy-converting hydrogenase Eha subunit B